MERALASAGELEQLAGPAEPEDRAQLHTRLAWAAAVAGPVGRRPGPGGHRPRAARPDAPRPGPSRRSMSSPRTSRWICPGPTRSARPRSWPAGPRRWPRPCRSADRRLPGLAAAGCAEPVPGPGRGHRLPGTGPADRGPARPADRGDPRADPARQRRRAARRQHRTGWSRPGGEAAQAGAVTSRYQAEASIALQAILRGDFAAAGRCSTRCWRPPRGCGCWRPPSTRCCCGRSWPAHRAGARDMEAALAELRRWGGDLRSTRPGSTAWPGPGAPCSRKSTAAGAGGAVVRAGRRAEPARPSSSSPAGTGWTCCCGCWTATAGWPEYSGGHRGAGQQAALGPAVRAVCPRRAGRPGGPGRARGRGRWPRRCAWAPRTRPPATWRCGWSARQRRHRRLGHPGRLAAGLPRSTSTTAAVPPVASACRALHAPGRRAGRTQRRRGMPEIPARAAVGRGHRPGVRDPAAAHASG